MLLTVKYLPNSIMETGKLLRTPFLIKGMNFFILHTGRMMFKVSIARFVGQKQILQKMVKFSQQ